MPLTVHLSEVPGTAIFQEWSGPDGTGSEIPPIGNVTYASDNEAVATVDSTGALAYVSAGVATISGADDGNSLTASDVLTVVTDTAVSATLKLVAGGQSVAAPKRRSRKK